MRRRAPLIALAALALARRRLLLVRVVGASMAPWAADGDRLLVRRGTAGLRLGAVVVGRPPALEAGTGDTGLFVKRVAALGGERVPGGDGRVPAGHCWVVGDAAGADSRMWGPVPLTGVIGVVVARVRRSRAQAGSPE